MLKNRFIRSMLITCTFLAAVFFAEIVYFAVVLFDEEALSKADAVVVFAGAPDRVAAGYALVGQGYADRLVITPASPRAVERYDAKFGWDNEKAHLYETRARTTFENAVHVKRIVRSEGLESIVLVTSRWHMPRSYFLMRSQLAGSGVAIYRHASEIEHESGRQWWKSVTMRRLVYGELLRFWGSLGECLFFVANGDLPQTPPKEIGLVRRLREILF